MKRFRLLLAMLVFVLAFGLAFTGCGPEDTTPRTMEGLFNELKDSGVSFTASNSSNVNMNWCTTDQAWEGRDSNSALQHNLPAPFEFSAATRLQGNALYTSENNAIGIGLAKDAIKKLNSFYASKYKMDSPPEKMDWYSGGTPIPDGTDVVVWYSFYLQSDSTGMYGSGANTKFPIYRQAYKF